MNIITRSVSNVVKTIFGRGINTKAHDFTSVSNTFMKYYVHNTRASILESAMKSLQGISNCPFQGSQQIRFASAEQKLRRMHKLGPPKPRKKKRHPFNGQPFAKGVILKTLIKKPKKPNSANRKCVLVRLSTGREMIAYVPGEGHSLQEHNIVLCRGGRCKDVPGVKIKCVRGKYDLPHVIKKSN